MSLNKKIWFYTEGFSEVQFVKWLFRRHFSHVKICSSEIEFLDTLDVTVCYIHNSRDIDKIPYDICDFNHWIERSKASPVIVCDIEKTLECPIARRLAINIKIDEDVKRKNTFQQVDKSKFNFVFSNPSIEEIYCFEKDITKSIIKNLNHEFIELNLSDTTKSPQERLKSVFRESRSTYKKREFAENFFSRLDYEQSKNLTVKRLFSIINRIICD